MWKALAAWDYTEQSATKWENRRRSHRPSGPGSRQSCSAVRSRLCRLGRKQSCRFHAQDFLLLWDGCHPHSRSSPFVAFLCWSSLNIEHRRGDPGVWCADSATAGICTTSRDGKVLISAPVTAVFREDTSVAFFHLDIRSVVSYKMRGVLCLRTFDSRDF